VRELDVETRYAALSPDGQHLAGLGPDYTFCTWDVATLTPDCVEERLPIREETITWSPDGTAVTFSLDAIRLLQESDIYVYELSTGTVANLTDDGVEDELYKVMDRNPPIDDVPVWSPDSKRIAFVRSFWGDEGSRLTTIMVIDRAGGEPAEVLLLDIDEPMAVWLPMHWLPDGTLLYSQISQGMSDPHDGLWKVGVDDGSSPLQVVPGNKESDVPAPKISDARQGKVIVYSYLLAGQFGIAGDKPLFWLVDLATGARAPLPQPPQQGGVQPHIIEVGLSPDGATALLVTMSSDGPFLMAMDVQTGEVVSLDSEPQDLTYSQYAPQWVANDTVLLQRPNGLVLVTLGGAP
jgi:Tol biopolymer transport system component